MYESAPESEVESGTSNHCGRRMRLHAVGEAFQQIGIGERQIDGDGNRIQCPQARFHLHRKNHVRHKRSSLRLFVFVRVKRKLDFVQVALQGVVVDDGFHPLPGLRIVTGEHRRTGLKCLESCSLSVHLSGKSGILGEARHRSRLLERVTRGGRQVLEQGSGFFAEKHLHQSLARGLWSSLWCCALRQQNGAI